MSTPAWPRPLLLAPPLFPRFSRHRHCPASFACPQLLKRSPQRYASPVTPTQLAGFGHPPCVRKTAPTAAQKIVEKSRPGGTQTPGWFPNKMRFRRGEGVRKNVVLFRSFQRTYVDYSEYDNQRTSTHRSKHTAADFQGHRLLLATCKKVTTVTELRRTGDGACVEKHNSIHFAAVSKSRTEKCTWKIVDR